MGNPRSHHALQNALPVADIIAHFGSAEPKEIAKEVSRLGQRDLQVAQAIAAAVHLPRASPQPDV